MQTLDGILASCSPKNESTRRRRPSVLSISSSRSKVNSMLSPIKETFDDFVQTVTEIPAVIEEGFDHFCHGMVDIPSSIEETFEEVLQCVNEFVLLLYLTKIDCSPRRSVEHYLMLNYRFTIFGNQRSRKGGPW